MNAKSPTMPFGKYKGQSLSTIPTSYLKWVASSCDDTTTWPWLKPAIARLLTGADGDDGGGAYQGNGNGHAGRNHAETNAGQTDYRNFTRQLLARGNWFAVPRALSTDLHLSPNQTLLLSHLLNRAQILADDAGWIPLGVKTTQQELNLEPDRQKAALHCLAERGLIAVRHGKGGRRVQIQLERLAEELMLP